MVYQVALADADHPELPSRVSVGGLEAQAASASAA
jgi:hypothetical protein